MLKQNKGKVIISTLIILLPMVAGCLLWKQLPGTLATHFDADNTPNGFSSKAFAVFGMPAILAALHLLCLVLTSADPKMKNIGSKPLSIAFWICPMISLLAGSLIYAQGLGKKINVGFVCCLFIGVLLVVLGNYLPKSKQNYSFGIKVPWTLHDSENWNHTHRVAGWSTAIAGVLIIITSFWHQIYLFFFLIAAAILIPLVYSYWYYRRHGSQK